AQPTFLQLLKLPDLSVFDQRLCVRVQLQPLGVHEAADYLLHLLRAEGGRPEKIITDEAIELIARETGGVPRLLNRAAHRAFQLAYDADACQVDVEAVIEALTEFGISAGTGSGLPGQENPATFEAAPASALLGEPGESAVLCMEDIVAEEAAD